jgi:hypothetical protein
VRTAAESSRAAAAAETDAAGRALCRRIPSPSIQKAS